MNKNHEALNPRQLFTLWSGLFHYAKFTLESTSKTRNKEPWKYQKY